MNKKGIIGIISVALIALATYYFLNNKGVMIEESKTVRIGVILPLSGDAANYGVSAREGFELAIEEINLKNPERKLILKFEDSKAQPKEATNAYLKLQATYDLPLVLGLISSPEVLSVAPLAEKNKTIIFSSGASSPLISSAGDFIFRNVPSDLLEASLMAETAFNKLNLKDIGIVYVNNDYGIGVLDKFKEKFHELGGNVVISETYDVNNNDFKTQLLKIKDKKTDGIYFIGYQELGRIIKQAKELNIESQYLSNAMFEDPKILEIAGEAAEGLIFSTFYFDSESKEPRTNAFVSSYRNKYDKTPDGFAVAAYDAVHVVFEALGKQEINAENIKTSLYKLENFNGLLGDFSFDSNGDVILPVKLKTVKNNEFINY